MKKISEFFDKYFTLFCFILLIIFLCINGIINLNIDINTINPKYLLNITLEFGGLVILCILAYGQLKLYKTPDKSTNYFACLLVFNGLGLLSDAIAWYVEGVPKYQTINYVTNTIYYLSGVLAFFHFWKYIKCILNFEVRSIVVRVFDNIVRIATIICVISVFVNLFVPIYFAVDEFGCYYRCDYFIVWDIFIGFIMVLEAIVIAMSKGYLREKICCIIYISTPIIGVVYQYFFFGISITFITVLYSLILLYVNIQLIRNKELEERETSILLSQIKPHFIQNCLSNIRGLIYENKEEAEEMIVNLSGYLRDTYIFLDEKDNIKFEQELELADFYLAIEEKRFPNSFEVVKNLGITDFYLPPLTIEPLIENAIRHGIREKDGKGIIEIDTFDLGRYVRILIKDNGVGFNTDDVNYGVGITNVTRRLMIKGMGKLSIESKENEGTIVSILIRKENRK